MLQMTKQETICEGLNVYETNEGLLISILMRK